VGIAAFALARINLHSPSAQAPSLSSDEPITPSLISYPVVSILSILDGDTRVPNFGGNPSRLHVTVFMVFQLFGANKHLTVT
jgi:hypothetical protein